MREPEETKERYQELMQAGFGRGILRNAGYDRWHGWNRVYLDTGGRRYHIAFRGDDTNQREELYRLHVWHKACDDVKKMNESDHKCILCESPAPWTWFCPCCTQAKEDSYKQSKEAGILTHVEVMQRREMALRKHKAEVHTPKPH